MREITVLRGDVRLHVVVWDRPRPAAPPLLLLHGLSSNSYFWTRVATRLQDRTVIAVDQRGHGASSTPESGYTAPDLAADAAVVLDALQAAPALVAGHSWGGTIALQLAADRPDLVCALALVDSPTATFSDRISWEQAQSIMQPPLRVYASLADASDAQRALLGHVWEEDLDRFVAHGLVPESEGWRLPLTAAVRLQILEAMYFQDYERQWAGLKVPVWLGLAKGSGRGPFYEAKRESAMRLSAGVPSLEVEWFETGHDIPVEDPAGIAAGLERLAARARSQGHKK